MIVPPTNVRVMIATKPVDFRKGALGLAAIVETEFKVNPLALRRPEWSRSMIACVPS